MVEADIFSFCLRRSGHTVIMNWIAAQVQPSHSFKDCNMTGGKLCTPVVHIIENNELKSEIYRDGDGLRFLSRQQRWQYINKYRLILCAFEDSNHIRFEIDNIKSIVEEYKLINNAKVVIVIRDPFNLFASRIWRNRNNNEVPFNKRATDWYNMQLEQWYNNEDFIFINYYKWVTEKTYRIKIAKKLEIPYSDNFYNIQANISSFDDFDYESVKAGFYYRWKQFLEKSNDTQKKEYKELLSNINMELASKFFFSE